MKLLCYFCTVLGLVAAEPTWLDTPVTQLRLTQIELPTALRTLARSCQINLTMDEDVTGQVTVDLHDANLRAALDAMITPGGYSYEVTPKGVRIHYRVTRLYPIDYPQQTRSGSGSASITLGGVNTGNQSQNLNNTNFGNNSIPGSDATQVSISQDNQNTFWNGLESELRAMLHEGDTLVLNKFSGVAQVRAPQRQQEDIGTFIAMVNLRITRQVEIEARIVEVTLRDEQKLGIDWDVATGTSGDVTWSANAPLQPNGVGGSILAASTFTANLGQNRVTAVIHALKQQGEVKTVAQPRLRALNNQTAFIKVGEDRPFFRLQQSTTFQQGGTTAPVNQTQENFTVSTITIGTILAVTPQIDAEGNITLDVLPAITRLQSIATSPDGRQTAPVTEVKQASTIVRLRDGETAVIGGLISEDEGETTRSIPVLGAIPLLGRAFRSQASLRNRTELVIFLTPKLIH